MPGGSPIAVTVEQGADNPAIQHSLKRFVLLCLAAIQPLPRHHRENCERGGLWDLRVHSQSKHCLSHKFPEVTFRTFC